jgi:hypothetical protein
MIPAEQILSDKCFLKIMVYLCKRFLLCRRQNA